jgi:hypothetical protein
MTISLPKPLAAQLRDYAGRAHGGKVSPAVAEILGVWFAAERLGVDLSVTNSEEESPDKATRLNLT